MKKLITLLSTFLFFAISSYAQDEITAFKGGTLLTVTHSIISNGTLIIKNGKIIGIGNNIPIPSYAKVIDVTGKVISPGLIDSGDYLGLGDIPGESGTIDFRENTSPIQAGTRIVDSYNPDNESIKVARAEGITEALIIPEDGNLFSGISGFISLSGEYSSVIASQAALHITLGSKSRYRATSRGANVPASTSRMGSVRLIRQAFLRARAYLKKGAPNRERNLDLEAIGKALLGKVPVIVSAYRKSDIEEAIALSQEFHFHLILSHAIEAYELADTLAKNHISVILGPLLQGPVTVETKKYSLENAAILSKAGVLIAIQTDELQQVRELPIDLEYAIGAGLSDEEALKSVTINPARMLHLEQKLGSLEIGKRADFVIYDGMPFHYQTHVLEEYIFGEKIDLSNHQTRLFDFYRKRYGL